MNKTLCPKQAKSHCPTTAEFLKPQVKRAVKRSCFTARFQLSRQLGMFPALSGCGGASKENRNIPRKARGPDKRENKALSPFTGKALQLVKKVLAKRERKGKELREKGGPA